MYSPLDRHGNDWRMNTFYIDTGEDREKALLKRIHDLEKENEQLKKNKNYADIVREVFQHTEEELFMGGKLLNVHTIADNIVFINSEHRMDANMMFTLQKHLNGRVLCGSLKGDVLVILCGVRHFE